MTVGLFVLVAFLAVALVAVITGEHLAMRHDLARRDKRETNLIRLITARLTTEDLAPGSELRAIRALTRDAVAAEAIARNGTDPDDLDELVEARRRATRRAVNEGYETPEGQPIVPSGSD